MNDPNLAKLQESVDALALELGLDSAIIIVTKSSVDDGTSSKTARLAGNFYASLGATREWLQIQDGYVARHSWDQAYPGEEG